MDALHEIIKGINSYLWGPPMLVILFGTHLFLTFRLRFIQACTARRRLEALMELSCAGVEGSTAFVSARFAKRSSKPGRSGKAASCATRKC